MCEVADKTTHGVESYETVRGRVFILSGPSGVGKNSVISELKRQGFPLSFPPTLTTRRRRENEVDGVDYFFVDEATFFRMRDRDELLEWAVVHDNNYGIPRSGLREGLRSGKDVMLPPDVQGGETLRRKIPGAVFIFLAPPSVDELLPRLIHRGTESPEEVATRLRNAQQEMEYRWRYDYLVLNHSDRLADAVESIKAIIIAERHRINPRLVSL
jgi:guanylate kinase